MGRMVVGHTSLQKANQRSNALMVPHVPSPTPRIRRVVVCTKVIDTTAATRDSMFSSSQSSYVSAVMCTKVIDTTAAPRDSMFLRPRGATSAW